MNKYWRLWAKSLGAKEGNTDKEADVIATIRTIIVLINVICAISICINIWILQ